VLRFVPRLLVAVAAATLIGGAPGAAQRTARAGSDGLQIVTHASYVVLPAEKRIHVSVQAWATNVTPDPPNGRYYYTTARFAVQPGTRNLTAWSGAVTLAAHIVSSSAESSVVEIPFGQGVFHGVTYPFTFAFDIVDSGTAARRDIRIGPSFAAFPVWAWGTAGTASTVSVAIPAGYTVRVGPGDLASSHAATGTTVLTASGIANPATFFAYITAERPGAFRQTSLTVRLPDGPVTVVIRTWDDDPAWGTRITSIVSRGLPVLRDLIGLDYQVHGQLRVEEAAGSRLGDYAGVYNPETETIDIRYDAEGYTTLHETAHTWFNDNLFTGRWVSEAWAEYYGVEAGKRIHTDGRAFVLTPQLLTAKIPLNAWAAVGAEPKLTEDYAYAASYRLAQLIAARAGTAGLQAVWRAAENGESSYQPSHAGSAPEKTGAKTAEGWQQLLDLLEERTKHGYIDLWRQWVVTKVEARSLGDRSTARADYARAVTQAASWELPSSVRYTLGAWQFGAFQFELSGARSVLAYRDPIATAAARMNLQVPARVRNDFEAGNFNLGKQDGEAELSALSALASATSALARAPSALESIGLLFADPAPRLMAARAAFENGDAYVASHDAQSAAQQRAGAADVGRLRVSVVGGTTLLLDGLVMGGLALRRRRRRRIAAVGPVGAEEASGNT